MLLVTTALSGLLAGVIQTAPTPPQTPPQQTPAVRPNLASLGRAQAREAVPAVTALDNPLDGFDLGIDGKSTTEYSAEDLGTLLSEDFEADTVAGDSLPSFDEEHRPSDTPPSPVILSP